MKMTTHKITGCVDVLKGRCNRSLRGESIMKQSAECWDEDNPVSRIFWYTIDGKMHYIPVLHTNIARVLGEVKDALVVYL